jgi:hypothetical protein
MDVLRMEREAQIARWKSRIKSVCLVLGSVALILWLGV